jgi:hypothetical protein
VGSGGGGKLEVLGCLMRFVARRALRHGARNRVCRTISALVRRPTAPASVQAVTAQVDVGCPGPTTRWASRWGHAPRRSETVSRPLA